MPFLISEKSGESRSGRRYAQTSLAGIRCPEATGPSAFQGSEGCEAEAVAVQPCIAYFDGICICHLGSDQSTEEAEIPETSHGCLQVAVHKACARSARHEVDRSEVWDTSVDRGAFGHQPSA